MSECICIDVLMEMMILISCLDIKQQYIFTGLDHIIFYFEMLSDCSICITIVFVQFSLTKQFIVETWIS